VSAWTEWEIVRHQATLYGRAVDADGDPLAKLAVTISSGPKEFESRVAGAARRAGAGWGALCERLDRTQTRSDGLYFFLDLPPGRYTVQSGDGPSGVHGGKTVSLVAGKDGRIKAAVADLKLARG
jgi:hypothetical protein